ncbi:MAG: HAD-IA family hydrolase [Candidatus Peribacteria bacterium]|jgi:HAD superfamily hydrolase (TIGR01509 family)|nr:HAD-IA family hydrolase [Candidatus Peribacteria bacterium]
MKTLLVDAGHSFIIQGQGIYQPLYDLLETYPNPKIALTNATPEQQITFPLTNLPYPLFSGNHQPEKTDPEYYEKLLHQFNLSPSEVVYFEHDLPSVESAKSMGITTYHYNEKVRDLEALKQFLDENLK